MRNLIIAVNNGLTRLRRVKVAPGQLLVLMPHCLQKHTCEQNVTMEVDRCKRCGTCDIGEMLNLRDHYGFKCCLASGGREAVAAVKGPEIKAVLAVACPKELTQGIWASMPKPVLAIPNQIPGKPCFDTRVSPKKIEKGIRSLLTPEYLEQILETGART